MSRFIAIDFETADFDRDSACAVGITSVVDYEIVSTKSYLIRPSRYDSDDDDFDFKFTYLHGISWADVAYEPEFGELWADISPQFFGAEFIAAHNASFDLSVLASCCEAYGIDYEAPASICTMKLARRAWSIKPTKLNHVCDYLDIPLNHHDAGSDAEACARVVIAAHEAGWEL